MTTNQVFRALTTILLLSVSAQAQTIQDANGELVDVSNTARVITLGGPVTETVFALQAGENVVAADTSSYYPAAAARLPKIGYQRALTAEGIISLKPTLVIGSEESGPPSTIEQLRSAGINVLILPREYTPAGTKKNISTLGQVFKKTASAAALNRTLDFRLAEAARLRGSVTTQPKVLFIYARDGRAPQMSGTGTSANAMIELAGAKNVFTGFEGYRPLTAEAAVSANPDVILMLSRGLEAIGGVDTVLKMPGIAQTNAGRNSRIIAMDDLYLLGFGPRLGSAAKDLTLKLHPELKR